MSNPNAPASSLMTTEQPKSKKPNFFLLLLGLLMIQLVNAGYNVVTKAVLSSKKGGANPLIFSLFRDAMAFPILQSAALFSRPLLPETGDIPRIFFCGLTGMFGNQFLFILGLTFTSPTVASVVQQVPIATFIISTIIGLDRFSWLKAFGVLVAFGGSLVVEGVQNLEQGGDMVWGSLCLLGAMSSMSIYLIIQKPLLRKYSAISVTAWNYFFGALTMAVASLYFVPWTPSWNEHNSNVWVISKETWYGLAFAVILNSCVKYYLQTICNKHVSAIVLTVFYYFAPIFTAILEWIVLGHELKLQYLGCIATFFGVFLVLRAKQQPPTNINNCQQSMLRFCIGQQPSYEYDNDYEQYSDEDDTENSIAWPVSDDYRT